MALSSPRNDSQTPQFTFGPFALYPTERRLLRDGAEVAIGSRALDILIALVEHAGSVVGKKALVQRVWPEVIVEESSLRVHVAALRKALGDGIDGARYITNVPGRGYSFIAPVVAQTSVASVEQTARLEGHASTPAQERTPTRMTSNLPARLTRMVGREATVAALSAQLRAYRFVTIVGPGGIGKTTVALSVAHLLNNEFTSVVFADLTAVTDAADVANGLAATLGLTVRKEDPTPEIIAFLRDTNALLVVDNCEHVVAAVGALAERIFIEAPGVYLLTTSRESLNVEGEHVYALDSLAAPETCAGITATQALEYASVQLFVERAGAAGSPIALSDSDAPIVAEICRRLDGIALAIELAAGRVGVFGIRGTADLLEKQLALTWRGRRTSLPRHQTLSATLDWSYNLLSPDEQLTLQRLSIFVGDFRLASGLAVAGEEGGIATEAIIENIANLVAKSLVVMRIHNGQPRYRLLEMVRAYSALKLAESGDSIRIAARHAKYFALQCRDAETSDSPVLDMRDLGNIRAALTWSLSEQGDAAIARDLSSAAMPLLLQWSLLAECRRWSARALQRLEDADRGSIFESRLIRTLAISTMFTIGNDESVRADIARGLELARSLNDRHGQFEFLVGVHAFAGRTGDFRGSMSAAVAGAEVADDSERASSLWMLCMSDHLLGNQREALARSERAASLRAVTTHPKRYFGYDQRALGLVARARVLWLTGHGQQALQAAKYAIDEAARLEHPVSFCLTLMYATSVYLWSERWSDAEHAIARLAETASAYSLEPYFLSGRALEGELLHARGEHAAALEMLGEASQRLNRERLLSQSLYCMMIWADALRATAQFGSALEVLDQAIEQRMRGGGSFEMPEMLRIRASILLGSSADNEDAAVECLERALELARHQGALSWELKAGLTLAELRPVRGKELLAGLLERFPADSDGTDLQKARSLFAG
jgi:predicted ATPase/DNA-binding winged helix-turn-helix (wHTH) protein